MIIGVGVILIWPDDTILLGQRCYPGEPATWCLPGGKVDPGESFEAAARRETLEECGIDPAPLAAPFAALLLTQAGQPCLTAAFAARVSEGTLPKVLEPHKIAGWQRFSPSALPHQLFGPTDAVLRFWRGQPLATDIHAYRIA